MRTNETCRLTNGTGERDQSGPVERNYHRLALFGVVLRCLSWFGVVWRGLVWLGLGWFGLETSCVCIFQMHWDACRSIGNMCSKQVDSGTFGIAI